MENFKYLILTAALVILLIVILVFIYKSQTPLYDFGSTTTEAEDGSSAGLNEEVPPKEATPNSNDAEQISSDAAQ